MLLNIFVENPQCPPMSRKFKRAPLFEILLFCNIYKCVYCHFWPYVLLKPKFWIVIWIVPPSCVLLFYFSCSRHVSKSANLIGRIVFDAAQQKWRFYAWRFSRRCAHSHWRPLISHEALNVGVYRARNSSRCVRALRCIFFCSAVVRVVQKTTSVYVCVWIDGSRQNVYCKISSWDQPFSLSWLCIYLVFVAVRGVRDSLWICQEIYRLLQCKSLEAPECWIITGVTPCTEIHLEQSLNKHIFIFSLTVCPFRPLFLYNMA